MGADVRNDDVILRVRAEGAAMGVPELTVRYGEHRWMASMSRMKQRKTRKAVLQPLSSQRHRRPMQWCNQPRPSNQSPPPDSPGPSTRRCNKHQLPKQAIPSRSAVPARKAFVQRLVLASMLATLGAQCASPCARAVAACANCSWPLDYRAIESVLRNRSTRKFNREQK